MRVPEDFIWGVATASYQIEGAHDVDGRGESIWDRFSKTPGKVHGDDTGDVACDHYHRMAEDVALIANLGVDAYRFSIAWPRVVPDGTGEVNHRGLDFYDQLVDELLESGIIPFPTLYHWDLPQALEDRGGWRSRVTAEAFLDYATAVTDRLGDRVTRFTTLNEPWCSAILGHLTGEHAPGLQDSSAALAAAHHLMLGHGLVAQHLHSDGLEAGYVVNQNTMIPASDHPGDVAAARLADQLMSGWFLDPVVGRGYPPEAAAHYGWDEAPLLPGDLDIISEPLDFIGLNYYSADVIADPTVSDAERGFRRSATEEVTDMGWPVVASGLTVQLRRLAEEYAMPAIYVTENGAAYRDVKADDGTVDDPDRISYLRRHFEAAADAIAAGVPLRGYFVWSLMDNFEWAFGYSKRFGLVHVDYATLVRTPKASYRWFSSVIESGL
ncbi:MAG TPA: GH1 family beta-glucosidase [Acidimicrobiia bacterium]|nr:GH1 family beta-glucosidase [Acidimicrobiia bacterium]